MLGTSMESYKKQVEVQLLGPEAWIIPKKMQRIVPPKVAMFLWQTSANKIAVKHNLMARGVVIENEGLCSSCGIVIETTGHLMLSCTYSWKLWYAVMSREGVLWCCPEQVKDLLMEWPFLQSNSDSILWDLIPYSLCWSLWIARNYVIFQNAQSSMESTWDLHIVRIMGWMKAW